MIKLINCKYSIKRLKNVFLMFFLMFSIMSCAQEINPDYLSICKEKTNDLRLTYLDQKGISKISTSIESDTLILNIQVSRDAKPGLSKVSIPENIKYIRYGNIIKEIDKLEICSRIYSGDEAKEYLKTLKK